MIVNVTEKHIADGVRYHCEQCPIALGLRDAFPGEQCIVIFRTLSKGSEVRDTTEEMRSFIRAFDEREDVKPFSFDFNELPLSRRDVK